MGEQLVKTKRKNEITLINILLFVLVIFIHVTSHPVTNLRQDSVAYLLVGIPWRLSAFAVQGFFFLSGLKLFLKKEEKIDYKKYYISRFFAVVVPYLLWATVYYMYFCDHEYYLFKFDQLFFETATASVSGHFYFVFVIIQFYALVPLWRWLLKKINHKLLLFASFAVMLTALLTLPVFWDKTVIGAYITQDKIFIVYLFYFIAGCLAGTHYEKFVVALKKNGIAICGAFLIIAVLEALFNIVFKSMQINFRYLELLHVAYCISAVLFVYFFALKITEKKDITKISLIKYLDGASYNVYLCHCLVIYEINDRMAQWQMWDIGKMYLIRFVVTYVISIGGCTLYCYLKKKYKKGL